MKDHLQTPTLAQAEAFLRQAESLNPGPWVAHSVNAARGAQIIASRCAGLDADAAYVFGLLHDICRRAGVTGARHIVDGYTFLVAQGYEHAARICLTHSFQTRQIGEIYGELDWTADEARFVEDYLARAEYTPYDRLIQLCDAIALPAGFCLMEKRFVDVAMRYGTLPYTVAKWRATLAIKTEFEAAIGCSIYRLLPGVVENTFGLEVSCASSSVG